MSIPGKVLIALLSALAVSAIASTLDPAQSLPGLLGPTAIAAVLAVLLSHRALPVPAPLAANSSTATPPQGGQGSAAARGEADSARAAARGRQRGDRRQRDRGRRNDETPPRKAAGGTAGKDGRDTASASGLETGTVKWFNVSKGYGFIVRENGEEIFVHHRSVRGEGRGRLEDGAAVRFRVADTDKGPQAEDVTAL